MTSNSNQYSIAEMSSKVIRSERQNNNEPDSNPTSVAGKISMKDMGDRAEFKETSVKPDTSKPNTSKPNASNKTAKPKDSWLQGSSNISNIEDLSYYPTNEDNANVLNSLMIEIHKFLLDASHDTIVSATDAVLEILKNEDITITKKRSEIDSLIDVRLSDIEFNELITLAKDITDYGMQQGDDGEDSQEGVPIVFEDEDEGVEEGDEDDEDEDEDEENEKEKEPENVPDTKDDDNVNGEVVVSTDSPISKDLNIISLNEIDEFMIQRKIVNALQREESVQSIVDNVTDKLFNYDVSDQDLESSLSRLIGINHYDVIKSMVVNRWRYVFKIKLLLVSLDGIMKDMESLGLKDLMSEFQNLYKDNNDSRKRRISVDTESHSKKVKPSQELQRQPKIVDLNALTFDSGSHLISTSKVKLPKGSYQQNKKLYDIITVPAPEHGPSSKDERLVPISELPEWAQAAFPSGETSSLNRIQSKLYPLVFKTDENILLCAPTGAGKTNVAMLAILRAIENHRKESGQIRVNDFKLVYIAPLKALVQEQMREFQRRLTANFGIVVNQLSGDSNLTKQQIMETQVLVTTPEKWDVITRKNSDHRSYTNLVKLIIIDEIHLLHDERGPVLESLVSRTLRQSEELDTPIRLIGLSATLPNYEDVATFLQVDFEKGMFYFDSSYRPCPLEQQYIAIKEKKAIKKLNAMNEACYDKMTDCISNGHQLIIFVHSRKDTFKTANWLKNKLIEEDKLDSLVNNPGVKEVLKLEAENVGNKNLQQILPSGFGIHHAGLNKEERTLAEDLFAQGHLKVLVSTATLAWGVNLPAHTVVIKGTETYSPEKGTWVPLSPQDILQMLGRAGRPRYDKCGEGVIITSQDEIQFYLAILNQQLPIESQLMARLADIINAEIVLGSISSLEDAISWLASTYLYIRMLKSPGLYHVGADYEGDKLLYWKRMDLCHSAFMILQENKLINYDFETRQVKPTELGKIASYYYINYETMDMYNKQLRPWLTEIDILKIFSSSGEFKFIPTRQEEKLEISKLLEKCPIPIKEDPSNPLAKVNILLQSYISKLGLEGFALMADMIYITQSAGRLLRALHEISLKKNWSSLSKLTLNLCKMVEKRMWMTNSPLRQFGLLASREIIRATENSHLPFVTYFKLNAEELAEAVNLKGNSRRAYELLQQFPKLKLSYYAQPLSHNLLRVQVEILPDWDWNSSIHGNVEQFLVLVEDCDGENILFNDYVSIQRNYAGKEYFVEFFVPITSPVQPHYFITLVNDKWLHSEYRVPLIISNMKIPKKSPGFTKLLDVRNIPVKELKIDDFIETFKFEYFNKFQSQVFDSLYNSNDDVFVGMSKGNGKTACVELAILNHWKQNKGRIVYINSCQESIKQLAKLWSKKYNSITEEGKVVDFLTDDLTSNLGKIAKSHLILATPDQFDFVSRRWRQRKVIQSLELMICDDVHMLSSGIDGVAYENIIARMRFISTQVDHDIRMVALGASLTNGRDFGDYLGCKKENIYNFDPSERFHPIKEIKIQSSYSAENSSMALGMVKPVYNFVKHNTGQGRTSIFLPDRDSCFSLLLPLITQAEREKWSLLRTDIESIQPYLDRLDDSNLKEALSNGIGYYHEYMNTTEKIIVDKLFESNILTMLLATKDTASYCPSANNVVIMGTHEYDGKEHRYVDYSVNTVFDMIGCSQDSLGQSKVLILTKDSKMNHYSRFLNDGIPLECYYHSVIHDIFISEICTGTFKTRQDCIDWLTFTYFYRRLQMNPSFYDAYDTSHVGVSEYLSDMIENTLKDLVEGNIVEIEEEDEEEEDDDDEQEEISPLNGGLISSHYNIKYETMMELNKLDNKSKLRGILEIVCSANEFEKLKIRAKEEQILSSIYTKVPVKSSSPDFESPFFKTFILLQAHFSRIKLPMELKRDLEYILTKASRIVCACVDSLSSEGYLNAIQGIDLSQMIVQGMWNRDTPLKQIPYFNEGMHQRCIKYNVETVYDIMTLEDEERDDVLQLEDQKLEAVAEFVNKYPNIDINYELDLTQVMAVNQPIAITINLERDEEMEDISVVAPLLPFEKREEWWIIIGDSMSKQLYAIKKTVIKKEKQSMDLLFTVPNAGHHKLSIWCMCDSYLDADKEIEFEIDVK